MVVAEPGHAGNAFGPEAQGFAAGGQYRHARRFVEKLADQRGRHQQMLEVVDDEQQLARRQPSSQSHARPLVLRDDHAERAGERRRNLPRGLKRGERDKPPPITPTRADRAGDLSSQTRLAHAAGTGEGDQTGRVVDQKRHYVRDFALAADEPCRGTRRMRRLPASPQRREGPAQPRDQQLKDMLRVGEVLEGVLAEVLHGNARRQPLAHGRLYGTGQENLTAVARGHDPRGAVHGQTFIALRSHRRLAGMQPHSHQHSPASRPRMSRQRPLRADRRGDRIPSAREDGDQAIALRAEFDAAVGVHGTAQDRPVRGKHLRPTIAQPPREHCRALDVGKHQGDGPRRELTRRFHPPTIAPTRPPANPGSIPAARDE